MIQFQENAWTEEQTEGWTDSILFYRTLPATAGGPKMDGTVLEEKSSFKMLMLTFSCKLDWGSYLISWSLNSFYEVSFS